MHRHPTPWNLWLLALVLALAGCIESRPRARKNAAAKPSEAAAVVKPEAVADDLGHLVEGERVKVEYDASDAFEGAAEPLVTIVEFSDFECPFCGKLAETLAGVVARYPDDVRLVFKQFPLPMHARAEPAARAAIAAHAQGKFWEMHDRLFADRTKLSDADILEHARAIGLDMPAFEKALADPATQARVAEETNEGRVLEVSSTPTFFVNGRKFTGAKELEAIAQIVDEERIAANKLVNAGSSRAEVYARFMRAAAAGKGEAKPVDPTHKRGEASRIPNYAVPVGEARPVRGPATAPVTIVWFAAYGCAECKAIAPTIAAAMDANAADVRVAVRQYPGEDPAQQLAARAAIAAHAQGKFWELHERLVQRDAPLDEATLRTLAGEVGLDAAKLQADMQSEATKAILAEDVGVADKVRGTQPPPFVFVNGRWLASAPTKDELTAMIAEEKTKADAFAKEKGVAPAALYDAMRPTWRGAANIDAVPRGPAGDGRPSSPVPTPDGGGKTDTPVRGPANAKVTIVACTDFDCTACARSAKALRDVMADYGDEVALQFRHQMATRKGAEKAHRAALAAARQGKFWEMHDALYENRSARSDAALGKLAEKVGLDVAKFTADMADETLAARIEEDVAACTSLGMQALPAFSIGGTVLKGGQSKAKLAAALDQALGRTPPEAAKPRPAP